MDFVENFLFGRLGNRKVSVTLVLKIVLPASLTVPVQGKRSVGNRVLS